MSQDWPVDPDGEEGSEGMRKFDMRIIADKVDEEADFPMDVSEFVDEYGEYPIRINHERVVALREIFEYVDAEEFEELVDMHKAVGAAMREGDFWKYHPEGSDPKKKPA
ncbi:DUF5785 family protein [Natronobacterium gregoryi]|uniref:Uncharacterized protein n=2 Tax=Natronobacterium gregoryi TaxID=44930 RepID=L0AM42_NATGS|nr:DUF5785 family protein [Natronobacterium gregoryi]AFZ74529.1 hypothetical protein Natgr_3409 [Natronobacterium gregoryi SP2]ELY72398.1 hypothetical protein C490_03603 [Natronobacterium gregoryi SP2]PLK21725.1 hypothetical protein CYV19_02500 [Natronobacterium gregoryi SP2]SFI97396.1 hypothetical protein SAMN05443661_110178 [Natronobacterium gregoryi]